MRAVCSDRLFRGDGVTLVASAFGDSSNTPVVLLHGGGQTRHSWGTLGTLLARGGFYVIAVDQRGHGDSDRSPDGLYDQGRFKDDLQRLITQLSAPPALVGASLGGTAALLAVGESEARLASALVLVDVALRLRPEGSQRVRDFMESHVDGFASLEEAAQHVAAYSPRSPPRSLEGLRRNLRQRADGRLAWHWDPRLLQTTEGPHRTDRLIDAARRVDIPVLLVRGRSSDITSDEDAEELCDLIPHCETQLVAGAGHTIAGRGNELFDEAVVEFLTRCVAQALP